MRQFLFVMMFVALFTAPAAVAQSTDPTDPLQNPYTNTGTDPCPTYDACTLQTTWWKPWTWGQKPPEPECPPKGTTCTTCKANCECEFAKAKNKCDNQVACIEIQESELRACVGNCYADTLDVC